MSDQQQQPVLPPWMFETLEDYWIAHSEGITQKRAAPRSCQNSETHKKFGFHEYNLQLPGMVCIYCNPEWCNDWQAIILELMQEERRGKFLFVLYSEQEARRKQRENEERQRLINIQRQIAGGEKRV